MIKLLYGLKVAIFFNVLKACYEINVHMFLVSRYLIITPTSSRTLKNLTMGTARLPGIEPSTVPKKMQKKMMPRVFVPLLGHTGN
jgi:hypothetical protein